MTSADQSTVRCSCGAEHPAGSYAAGFISGSGMCEKCDAAMPAKDIKPMGGEMAIVTAALKFYADGDHFLLADPDAWDTCSGEPINFQHDDAGTASVEDGSIAKNALARLVNAIEYTACVADGLSVGMGQEEAEQQADSLNAATVTVGACACGSHEPHGMSLGCIKAAGDALHAQPTSEQPDRYADPSYCKALESERDYLRVRAQKSDRENKLLITEVGRLGYLIASSVQSVNVPQCVLDWFEAKQAHFNAVAAYNTRQAFIRKHMPFGTSLDPEYQIMESAERKVRNLVGVMFDGLCALIADPDVHVITDSERLAFMLADRRKVVVERLVGCGYSVYVEHGVMGEKQYPAVAFKGDSWEDDSVETLAVKRKAIDVAITSHRAAATEPGAVE